MPTPVATGADWKRTFAGRPINRYCAWCKKWTEHTISITENLICCKCFGGRVKG